MDVFDGAGSGDGIDGRLSTTSEKMLVITIKLESIISTHSFINQRNLSLSLKFVSIGHKVGLLLHDGRGLGSFGIRL